MKDGSDLQFLHALPETMRERAAALYLEAFWGKFRPILGDDRTRAVGLFAPRLRLDRVIVAVNGDDLLGLAGFKDAEGGFIDATLGDLRRVYGWFGGLWRGLALSIFERKPKPDELLMDGIVVDAAARGQGVGTSLLSAIEMRAQERGAVSIRLDVVDTNPGARRLYERFGFEAVRTEKLGFLRPIFGFSASTEMRKTLIHGEA